MKAKETPQARIERRKAEIEYLFKRIAEMETSIKNHTERISHLSQLNWKDSQVSTTKPSSRRCGDPSGSPNRNNELAELMPEVESQKIQSVDGLMVEADSQKAAAEPKP